LLRARKLVLKSALMRQINFKVMILSRPRGRLSNKISREFNAPRSGFSKTDMGAVRGKAALENIL
jgi:hypothetical protein